MSSKIFRSTVVRLSSLQSFAHIEWSFSRRFCSRDNVNEPALDFNNSSLCFRHRSTRDLLRAFMVLHACSIDAFVDKSHTLLKLGERILGEYLLQVVVSPFYYQFVAGNSEDELQKVAKNLASVGLALMIAPLLETDVGEEISWDSLSQKNFTRTLFLIDQSSRSRPPKEFMRPICQTKFTAHLHADILFKVASSYDRLEDYEKQTAIEVLSRALCNPSSLSNLENSLSMLKLSKEDMFGIGKALPRLFQIGEACRDKRVILTVDAEYSYVNKAISLLSLAMMKAFNGKDVVIWNTYQAYLKNAKMNILDDYTLSKSIGTRFGIKLVRGAYMEKERQYAELHGTADPTNSTYEDTNDIYNSIVDDFTENISENPELCQMVVATHNEESILNATRKLKKLGTKNIHGSLVFAQIYGMAENISVPLAKAGYSIYKSVPYGTMGEALPYLARRANENKAVFHGARKERALLYRELKSRLA